MKKNVILFDRSSHSIDIDYSIYADASYVENAGNDKNKVIIDSRERLNFLTEHIPNSKNIPYAMIGFKRFYFEKTF